ncbi:MAG TPA: molecular chaperone DnaJ [Polyangiaceae bacterium]|nr:molecular chaperone DnaJ [Polyangiaceae bacterium]
MHDPYDVLGVERGASPDEVKSAFRRLAQRFHPDRNPGDDQAQQKFKEINAAYQVLSDPEKREMFDRFGAAGAGDAGPGGGFDFGDLGNISMDGIFGDLLRGFGIRTGDRGDLKKEIVVTFEEAAFGVDKELTYERTESCKDCRGSGSDAGHARETCSACMGRGRVRFQQGLFPVAIERTCSRCHGAGKIVTHPCAACRGAGVVSVARTIEVTIPAGIENGATRMVERGGNVVRAEKPAGDLELTVTVAPHPFFKRQGDDVVCSVPISFTHAALGGEIEVPTLEGRGKLKIPAGTQPGSTLRIKGKGIVRRTRGGRGDQLVEVGVEVPTSLTARQRELLAELAKELGDAATPQQKTFVQKLKDFFG